MKVTIDGREHETAGAITILEAARELDIAIPTLCHNDYLIPYGGCRVCLVEAAFESAPDKTKLVPACTTMIADGMIVKTDTERVAKSRQFIIEMLLSRAPEAEEIKDLARDLGVPVDNPDKLDVVGDYLLNRAPKRFNTQCILCGQCVRVCAEVTERHALSFTKRGIKKVVHAPFDKIAETCIGCGSCAYVCPTNTITVEEVT